MNNKKTEPIFSLVPRDLGASSCRADSTEGLSIDPIDAVTSRVAKDGGSSAAQRSVTQYFALILLKSDALCKRE